MKHRERLLASTSLINFLGLKLIEHLERNKEIAKNISTPYNADIAEENILWANRFIKEYEQRLSMIISKLEGVGEENEFLSESDLEYIENLQKIINKGKKTK